MKKNEAPSQQDVTLHSMPGVTIVSPGIMLPIEKSKIDSCLTKFIALSNVPFSIVEDELFKQYSFALNPKYSLPSRSTIVRNISTIYETAVLKAIDIITNVKYFSISCDFWSVKRLGIYGLLILYFDDTTKSKKSILLSLKHVEYPHTGKRVLEITDSLLKKFGTDGIKDIRLTAITCDNGSNMRSAFDKLLPEYNNDGVDDYSVSDDSDGYISEQETETIEKLVDNYLIEDVDIVGLEVARRIGCTNHAINNNLKSGIKNSSIENFIKKAIDLLVKIKSKGICADILNEKNATIILPPPTRWTYHFDCFNNMIKIREAIAICCQKLNIDNLANSEYEILSELTACLKKYTEIILKLESPTTPMSKVIPALISLKLFLRKASNLQIIEEFRNALLSDFERRFCYIFDTSSLNFSEIFLVATAIDINERKYLSSAILIEQKKFIDTKLDLYTRFTVDNQIEANFDTEYEEFTDLQVLPEAHLSEYKSFCSTVSTIHNIQFWDMYKDTFPILYNAHQKILSMSPTSCQIETAFSLAALSSGVKGRRNRLKLINLEKENFLKFNKFLLNE